jgi:hypothetical protein
MEGNLSRARSSLYITSSSSMSSIDSGGSTPSPPMFRTTATQRGPVSPNTHPGHARMPSENALPSEHTPQLYPTRSASALGAAGGYRQPLTSSRSVDTLHGGFQRPPHKVPQLSVENGLEPLSEDESGLQEAESSRRDSAQLASFLSPTFGSYQEKGLTRSASVTQMRDLKDQMKDLKGKISSLREQARADSLKRRSFQSLRTPSPFTHARVEQWYAGPTQPDESDGDNAERNPWNGELSSIDGDNVEKGLEPKAKSTSEGSGEQNSVARVESETLGNAVVNDVDLDDMDDMRTEDGNENENEEDGDYQSESGDSLYHDTFQTPISHEDREDAFDYEHFFLHSAMGTISQQRLARRGSLSSEGSVETTRGPISSPPESKDQAVRPRHHNRRGSGDTTSTVESFATADESRNEMEEENGSKKSPKLSPGREDVPRPDSPVTARRAKFGPGITDDDTVDDLPMERERHNSVIRRPQSKSGNTSLHRPSVSSFESTGTTRSFPLVNKPKMNGGVLTPQGSPDQELKQLSESLLSETASICDKESNYGGADHPIAMQMLQKEDQILVERLVASLGRCVLGLTESGRASAESRVYRRRIDAARRILEGLDGQL